MSFISERTTTLAKLNSTTNHRLQAAQRPRHARTNKQHTDFDGPTDKQIHTHTHTDRDRQKQTEIDRDGKGDDRDRRSRDDRHRQRQTEADINLQQPRSLTATGWRRRSERLETSAKLSTWNACKRQRPQTVERTKPKESRTKRRHLQNTTHHLEPF